MAGQSSTSVQWPPRLQWCHIIIGPVTLNGSCVVSTVPANRGAPVSTTLGGPLSGAGSLIKSGIDPLILGATNNYSGTTTVSGGSLIVDGINLGTNIVMVSGGTLGGTGAISGPVTISSGGTLSPGDTNVALSRLSISNKLNLGGTCSADLDKTAGVLTSDLVTNITVLALGGTLQLNLNGDPLVSGAFATIVPSEPGTGLQWDTSHLTTDGTLRVSSVNSTPTNITAVVSGNQLTLSWPADHTGWRLQVQTNSLSTGLGSNWVDVAGSTSVNSMSFTINPPNGTVFYRMVYP